MKNQMIDRGDDHMLNPLKDIITNINMSDSEADSVEAQVLEYIEGAIHSMATAPFLKLKRVDLYSYFLFDCGQNPN